MRTRLMPVPIVAHMNADAPAAMRRKTEELAEVLQCEHPELTAAAEFRELIPERLTDGPTLHIDDLSEITRLDQGEDIRFYQDRARLRAGDGDCLASCGDLIDGHEEYCRDVLGLGAPQWLRPRPPRNPMRIAEACWEDETVRETLLGKLRRGELAYLHPHMGTFAVWELAALLQRESGCPLKVVAPHPRLTRWVNNKVAFTEVVTRLFGSKFVPRTESAWNLSLLARRLKDMADQAEAIGLKLPDAGGGSGNVILPSGHLRGQSLKLIEQTVRAAARAIQWHGDRELLVDVWESDVVSSPSVQMWLPPDREEPPIVEGIFEQNMESREGMFVGARPAELPPETAQEIADRCWLLARLFQHLGYVGRCSFDMILVGQDTKDCRCKFIECNGRWGGTSLPMTLMNRVFGDWSRQPFGFQIFHHIDGLQNVTFAQVLDIFADDLFDAESGSGSVIFYNPGRLAYQAGISAIVLGQSWKMAAAVMQRIAVRLRDVASESLSRKGQRDLPT